MPKTEEIDDFVAMVFFFVKCNPDILLRHAITGGCYSNLRTATFCQYDTIK